MADRTHELWDGTSMTPMEIDSGSGNKNAHPTSTQQGRGCTPVAPRLNVVSGGEPRLSAKMGVYFSRRNGTWRGPPGDIIEHGGEGRRELHEPMDGRFYFPNRYYICAVKESTLLRMSSACSHCPCSRKGRGAYAPAPPPEHHHPQHH